MHKYEFIPFRSNYLLKPNDLDSECLTDELVSRGLTLDYFNKKRMLIDIHYWSFIYHDTQHIFNWIILLLQIIMNISSMISNINCQSIWLAIWFLVLLQYYLLIHWSFYDDNQDVPNTVYLLSTYCTP